MLREKWSSRSRSGDTGMRRQKAVQKVAKYDKM